MSRSIAWKGKVEGLLAFCSDLKSRLPRAADRASFEALSAALKDNVGIATKVAQKTSLSLDPVFCNDLDREAVETWNLTTKLRRDKDSAMADEKRPLFLHARVFCFLLIDIARRGGYNEHEELTAADLLHLLQLSLKAAMTCLDEKDLDKATDCLHKSAMYLQDAQNRLDLADYGSELAKLDAEYLIIRTALAWKHDQLDVAEHMYQKSDAVRGKLDPHSAEKLADVLSRIGHACQQRKDYSQSAKWLGRAFSLLDHQELDYLSRCGADMRLSTLHSTIHAMIQTKDAKKIDEAKEMIAYNEADMGDTFSTLMLRVQLLDLAEAESVDADEYEKLLLRMVTCFSFSESQLKLILHHLKRLFDFHQGSAGEVLDLFLEAKLLGSETVDWIERAMVLRVWMATTQTHTPDFTHIDRTLTKAHQCIDSPLQPHTAVAVQALIWQRVTVLVRDGGVKEADEWCLVGGHELLKSSGALNRAIFQRKRIQCATSLNNVEKAKSIFNAMDEKHQNEAYTRFLMFKVALRDDDGDLGQDCLQAIMSIGNHSGQYLYACILEAQKMDNRQLGVQAMKALTRKHNSSSTDIHYPSLLRCTIRMLGIDAVPKDHDQAMHEDGGEAESRSTREEDICELFETAAMEIKREAGASNERKFGEMELRWFYKNAYNTGLQNSAIWETKNTLRLFRACLTIMDSFPKEADLVKINELSLQMMCCNFVVACALVSLARGLDSTEERLQCYLETTTYTQAFDKELQAWVEVLGEHAEKSIRDDLCAKLSTLLIFEFEADLSLKYWEKLGEVVRKAKDCRDVDAYKAMAHCLMRASEVPTDVVFSTLREIINAIWEVGVMDMQTLGKYIRLLFQTVYLFDSGKGIQVLQESVHFMKEARKQFPTEEVEWLATTAWNHALDYYGMSRDDEFEKWATRAMEVAHFVDDGAMFVGQIEEKFQGLKSS